MREFYTILFVIFSLNAVALGGLAWAFHARAFHQYRINPAGATRLPAGARIRGVITNSLVSLAMVLGATGVLFGRLFHERPSSVGVIALQACGILVVYDFAYYFLHRGLHNKRIMRFVHGMHHRAKSPTALESFFLHPVELLAGLTLLMVSTWIVGPVHIHAFGAAFFVYSMLNIFIHSGLDFKKRLLAPIDFLTRKHHVHHFQDFGKNFSSLTPLPDLIFGTAG